MARRRRLNLDNERDASLNQFEINQLLVYAVYGMIASIVALFILLKWYPGSLTELIVEQRVIVEVLSMGFLLVTVIILGSAKLITGEGLAGLLGTIAGYIFAKKASELLAGRPGNRPAAAIERQLAQAHLEAEELETQLKRLEVDGGDAPNRKQRQAMERRIRVKYANAVYHVTDRGSDRKTLYRDDAGRQRFLETVEEAESGLTR